ncbi:hypothetical protein OAQ99_01545 [Candidatus Kapabacteria bacterium]|nr:hypothetical protein [Candidatus Kapabacteria bacterium]
MNINLVNKGASLYTTQEKKAQETKQEEVASSGVQRGEDKLELSSQAQQLSNVQQRIEQGFYDRPEVLRQVARRISNEIDSGDS